MYLFFRFYEWNSQRTHILLYLPFVKLTEAPDIDCYVVATSHGSLNSLNIPYKDLAKSSLYEFVSRGNLIPPKVKINKIFFLNGFLLVYTV